MEEKKLTDEEIVKALDKTKQELENISPEDEDYDKLLTVKIIVDYCHDLIHRLQENNANQVRMRCDMQRKFDDLKNLCTEQGAENEQLKKDYIELDLECRELRTELDKELADHEEFTKKANEEIERLTREVDKQKNFVTSWEESWKIANEQNTKIRVKLKKENAELQKQVDELKKTISIKVGYIDRVESEVVEWQFATKKAVKDTAKEILIPLIDCEKQIDPLKTGIRWSILKGFCKKFDVEVE